MELNQKWNVGKLQETATIVLRQLKLHKNIYLNIILTKFNIYVQQTRKGRSRYDICGRSEADSKIIFVDIYISVDQHS